MTPFETWGATPEQIADLLRVASTADTPNAQRRALMDIVLGSNVHDFLGTGGGTAIPAARDADTLRSRLISNADPIDLFASLKDHFKDQARLVASGDERHVATSLYYAAIAGAIVHHDAMITSLPPLELLRSFGELSSQEWIDSALRGLFKLAMSHEQLHGNS